MTESELYQKQLKPEFESLHLFFERIDLYSHPDLYLSLNGNSLWAEIKCVNVEYRGTIHPKWRPGQLAWIRKSFLLGGNSTCLILWYQGKIYWLPPKEYYTKEELVCQKENYLKRLQRQPPTL